MRDLRQYVVPLLDQSQQSFLYGDVWGQVVEADVQFDVRDMDGSDVAAQDSHQPTRSVVAKHQRRMRQFAELALKQGKKGMLLYSAVSSPLERSKYFTLLAPPPPTACIPVHSDINSVSPGSNLATQQLHVKTKSVTFPPLSIAR